MISQTREITNVNSQYTIYLLAAQLHISSQIVGNLSSNWEEIHYTAILYLPLFLKKKWVHINSVCKNY